MDIHQTLEKLKGKQQPRKEAKYIYQDEQTKEIKETPLSDSAAASVHINRTNPTKLIHQFIFGH